MAVLPPTGSTPRSRPGRRHCTRVSLGLPHARTKEGGGQGVDTVADASDFHFTLRSLAAGMAKLTTFALDQTVLSNTTLSAVEQAVLTGGDGNNRLDAGRF